MYYLQSSFKRIIAVAIVLFSLNLTMSAQTTDVYVCGVANGVGTIWKNAEAQAIDGALEVNRITANNGDIYSAGKTVDMGTTIYKNGEALYALEDGETFEDRTANSIFVSGDDVYVTANDLTPSWMLKGKLWHNGEVVEGYENASELYDAILVGEDLYVAGGIGSTGIVWKNGSPLYTHESSGVGLFVDLFAEGDDIYCIGGDFAGAGKTKTIKSISDAPVYAKHANDFGLSVWKNGEPIMFLGSEVYSSHLFVADGVVYTCGQVPDANGNVYLAALWTNGERQLLTDVWSAASSLAVHNGDVYITGFMGNFPELDCYLWKNGEITSLATGGTNMGDEIVVAGGTTAIEEEETASMVYPNPANDCLFIEGIGIKDATIYNIVGQSVMTINASGADNCRMNISALAPGVYLLKVNTISGNSLTKRVVIEK